MNIKTLLIVAVGALALVLALGLAVNTFTQPNYQFSAGTRTLGETRAQHDALYGAGSFDRMWQGSSGPGVLGGTPYGVSGPPGPGPGMMGGSYGGMMGGWR